MKEKEKKKAKKVFVNWYLEPLNAETNQAIAELLSSTNDLVQCSNIKLDSGETRPAYQLSSYQAITRLRGSLAKFGFKYQVYCQKGPYGPIKRWIFQ